MRLTLVELDRPVGERFWFPFTYEEAGLGFNNLWWYGSPVYPHSKSVFLRVVENNNEVARVHLDNEVEIDHYADVPPLGATALEIQFIEVHDDHRGCGIGRAVIGLLHNRYPDRRLVAFSEGADGFWSSLGWRRHLHADPEEASFFRPLFIQPRA
ncbi:N-acetyltransferase [Micromonospora craniellae]|uniref:GNAT family N-acetyltransferase n=1 Tax=Micromonospora craniellae TaxID=2294034 RepID=A0A372FTS3_9ACTN|nr:GNAT family N-acetyltransferase [Micromonospora craniellae]QOC89675.1 GNAT family N-acetyltransferase [Micromonospora craniellae]RFS44151.1 GNAT family N-acetyltransferase [Micromonospora craniellae]